MSDLILDFVLNFSTWCELHNQTGNFRINSTFIVCGEALSFTDMIMILSEFPISDNFPTSISLPFVRFLPFLVSTKKFSKANFSVCWNSFSHAILTCTSYKTTHHLKLDTKQTLVMFKIFSQIQKNYIKQKAKKRTWNEDSRLTRRSHGRHKSWLFFFRVYERNFGLTELLFASTTVQLFNSQRYNKATMTTISITFLSLLRRMAYWKNHKK